MTIALPSHAQCSRFRGNRPKFWSSSQHSTSSARTTTSGLHRSFQPLLFRSKDPAGASHRTMNMSCVILERIASMSCTAPLPMSTFCLLAPIFSITAIFTRRIDFIRTLQILSWSRPFPLKTMRKFWMTLFMHPLPMMDDQGLTISSLASDLWTPPPTETSIPRLSRSPFPHASTTKDRREALCRTTNSNQRYHRSQGPEDWCLVPGLHRPVPHQGDECRRGAAPHEPRLCHCGEAQDHPICRL